MTNPFLLIFIGIGIIVAIWNYYFSRENIIRRKLQKAAGKRISEFQSGEIAKVVGKVEFIKSPLTAPLSKRKCAYYQVLVEQKVSTGKSSYWRTVIDQDISQEFLIKDGKHYAYVKGKGITVNAYLVRDGLYSSGFLSDATPIMENYLRKHNQTSENFLGMNKRLEYKEGALTKGELIAIAGLGTWKKATEFSLPEQYGQVLEITSTPEHPIYLSDDSDTFRNAFAETVIKEIAKS